MTLPVVQAQQSDGLIESDKIALWGGSRFRRSSLFGWSALPGPNCTESNAASSATTVANGLNAISEIWNLENGVMEFEETKESDLGLRTWLT